MVKIRPRALIVSAAALLSAISFTGVALAAASRPALLSTVPGDRTAFLVRPMAMSFTFDYRLYPSGQASVIDYIGGSNATLASVFHTSGRIRWRRWGTTAVADAAYFIGDETGHYIRRTVTIRAWRVRRGRYTRFTIDLGSRGIQEYVLTRTRLKASGAPHGISAYAWCLSAPLRRAHACVLP